MKKIRRSGVATTSEGFLMGNGLKRRIPTAGGHGTPSGGVVRRPLDWLLTLALILTAICVVPGPASAAGTGHITGVVTGAGGSPLEGVEVQAYLQSEQWDSVAIVWTGSDGTYDLGGLATGTYRVRFAPGSGSGYLNEYYDNVPFLYAATDIAVVDGSTASGKNAELAVGGNVTGTVTGADNLPLFGITVTAWTQADYNWYPDYSTVTKVDGTYDLKGLPTDDAYILEFSDESDTYITEYFDDTTTFSDAQEFPVTAGTTISGKNAQLALSGHITGTVTGTGGVPLPDVSVDVYRNSGGGWKEIQLPGWGTFTAADGTYQLDHLSTGSYRLKFSTDGGYAFEYYNNAATVGSATDIAVTGGSTTSGRDVQLTPGGDIAGTVTGLGGVPLEDVAAIAYRNDGHGWEEVDQWGWTYGDGNYAFGGLPAGTYRLKFADYSDARSRYATEYYDNAATVTTATDVQVSAGSTIGGRNAQLAPGGNITGTVTGTGGIPVGNVWVRAYVSDGDGWALSNDAATAEDGTYDLGGLPTGTYRIGFTATNDYATEYYDNVSSLEAATNVQVTGGSTTSDKNVQLSTEPIPAVVNTVAPSVSGTAQVGSTLTATTGTWDPSTGLTFSYRWLVDGTPVAGATSSTYVPLAGDVGKTVRVKVEAIKAGYATGTATSAPTATVVAATAETPTIANMTLPKVSGTPKVGAAVTATPGTWSSTGATFTYQWLLAGSPIARATSQTYKPAAKDVGKLLQIRVTASATEHISASATSAAAAVGKGTLRVTQRPKITGKAKKNATVRVSPGTWSPAKVKVTYQWFAGKKAIPKATAAKLKLTGKTLKAAAGKAISVLVTVTAPAYVTASAKLQVRGKA